MRGFALTYGHARLFITSASLMEHILICMQKRRVSQKHLPATISMCSPPL